MEEWKLDIAKEALNEVSVEFPETKQFIEENLEQKCLKENVLVEEIFFFNKPKSKELTQQII